MTTLAARLAAILLSGLTSLALSASAGAFEQPFIGQFSTVTSVGSTVPANGDVNPYGIAVVPRGEGALVRGDLLISNFNDQANEQGTGSTIVQETPTGQLSLFAHVEAGKLPGACPGGVGLTTALAILPHGYVVVGSLPTSDGSAATAKAGCLIVLDRNGKTVETIAGPPINGPWDMTSVSDGNRATLFVTNVLNRTVASGETPTDGGTVVRIGLEVDRPGAPHVTSMSVIATGFFERTDPAALVIGPTGLGLGSDGRLYVADTLQSRIAAIPDALHRQSAAGSGGITVAKGGYLNSPLGLAIAPNGDVLTTNGGDGNLVETTPVGAEFQPFDTGAGEGGLFGLAIGAPRQGVWLVDDANNTLALLH
ncbi:MAG TPA: hypothetical protein VHU13_10160 [Solirubrobacteraceae bacterium]|jgi:hypothetical protein|nr:hypothetical protein [Solirubrobacteraceae bacterium]